MPNATPGNMTQTVDFRADAFPADMDIEARIREELFKTAIDMQNRWADHLADGTGIGQHRGPYVNTGEAVASIDIDPPMAGAPEYTVFSDTWQVLIAEVGRAPGSKPPPFAPIADWVHEKLGIARDAPDFHGIVRAVQMKIARDGLAPFLPMEKSIAEVVQGLEQRMGAASSPDKDKVVTGTGTGNTATKG